MNRQAAPSPLAAPGHQAAEVAAAAEAKQAEAARRTVKVRGAYLSFEQEFVAFCRRNKLLLLIFKILFFLLLKEVELMKNVKILNKNPSPLETHSIKMLQISLFNKKMKNKK